LAGGEFLAATSGSAQESLATVLVQAPAAEVVRAGDDAGAHALGDPDRVDEVPMRVETRTRSSVSTPMRARVLGWIHTGLVFESSYSHFEFAERVWISVGRRKVGTSTYSPFARSSSSSSTWLSDVLGRRELGPAPVDHRLREDLERFDGVVEARARRLPTRRRATGLPSFSTRAFAAVRPGSVARLHVRAHVAFLDEEAAVARMYSSGDRPSFAAAAGRPGTEFSKIQR
jgi:hypothetical protein